MSVDPSHYLPAANGGKPPLLKLQNISVRPELNGQFGQAVSFSADRYVVALLDATTAAAAAGVGSGNNNNAQQPTFLKLKPENLTEAGTIDQLKFGVGMILESAKAYIAGPSVQEWGKRIMALLPPPVRAKLTPDRALIGAAVVAQSLLVLVYFILGRFLGFTKLFTFVSLVTLMLAVSSPDWVEGYKAKKPFKLVAKNSATNFTRRWKENMVFMTGYTNISEKMALASLVFVVVFSGKVLLTPMPPSSLPTPQMPNNVPMSGDVEINNPHRIPPPRAPPRYDLEHIYKLGYDDAHSGKEFGTSLPEDIIKYNAAQEEPLPTHDQYDDGNFEWAYNPPPPPPPKSKSSLGMGTMFSMFTLYRFGKDTVTSPDGSIVLDPAYIIAQLRSMEPWRLGLMGMSLYRVVSALSSLF